MLNGNLSIPAYAHDVEPWKRLRSLLPPLARIIIAKAQGEIGLQRRTRAVGWLFGFGWAVLGGFLATRKVKNPCRP